MGLRSLFGGRRRAREERAERVRLAAAEAAQDDPLFDPDAVERRAGELFVAIQAAWSRNDIDALRAWVGPDLMVEWEARLADFARKGWRNTVDVLDGPEVQYVGLTNRAGDAEDRAVVSLTARLHDVVVDRHGATIPSNDGAVARISEYWTLGKREDTWVVVSIEQEREGAHHLSAPLVAAPEGDTERLRTDAVMEVAAADTVAADEVGELLSPGFTGTAEAAALDLSVVDGRFSPDVLAAAIGEVVGAWAAAIDGPDHELETRTTPEALSALLYPTASGRDRLVIRGQRIESITIDAVEPGPPAQVGVVLTVTGIQYVEDRDTTEVVAGSKRRRTTTRQSWTLRLADDPHRPWTVVSASGVIPR